ncbi:MAG TPA: sugar phosphate isomerase/epimerase [Longimicrobiaceae bacterium]|nr:sugar phosphate isomerase/epimerase [Longimicrobiaceae bacterium]
MHRRAFLSALAGAAAGAAALRRAAAAVAREGRPIGVQLYTVRELLARDFEGTLARVAEIGYREVEFAGYFSRSPAQVRRALGGAGLDAPGAHVDLDAIGEGWERTLAAAAEMGHRYLIVPWIPEVQRTPAGYRRLAERFNRAGEQARRAGIRFGFHNHDYDFAPVGGEVPYDVLLAETDPELVVQELDLFWIAAGGGDPLEYFARFPGRFHLVHLKDMDATPQRRMTDVGQGAIDFARILAHARQAGIRHYFVEHDSPASPLASIRASYEFVRRLEIPA